MKANINLDVGDFKFKGDLEHFIWERGDTKIEITSKIRNDGDVLLAVKRNGKTKLVAYTFKTAYKFAIRLMLDELDI